MFPFYSAQANLGTSETYLDGFSYYLLVLCQKKPVLQKTIMKKKVPSLYIYDKKSKGKSVDEH